MLANTLKILFFALVIRPIVLIGLGLNLIQREKLPLNGPAIIAANHNSHLDTMVLMSLFPLRVLPKVRPVAAADYFLRNRILAWFSLKVIGIIPLDRQTGADKERLFEQCHAAIQQGQILILFPEGTRGDPETLQPLKKGLFYLARPFANLRVIPVVMHGLGRAMPKGAHIFVPFNCDVVVGDDVPLGEDASDFTYRLNEAFQQQLERCLTRVRQEAD